MDCRRESSSGKFLIGSAIMVLMLAMVVTVSVVVAPTAEARACLPDDGDCGNGFCEGDCKAGSLRCDERGVWVLDPTCTAQPPEPETLAITNLSHTPSGTEAVVTWRTNQQATSGIRWGSTPAYGDSLYDPSMRTAHSMRITGLNPGTTYYYEVQSVNNEGRSVRVGPRTFTTTSGLTGGGPVFINRGPSVNATATFADVEFDSNVATAALVEFSQQPNTDPNAGNPGYATACDIGSPCPPPAMPTVVSVTHRIRISGLAGPGSSDYRYRVTIKDGTGTTWSTAVLDFRSGSSSTDYTFTTGGCNDGTVIGQCNVLGQYCPVGGGDPIYDCRPTTPCPKSCDPGLTCRNDGSCLADPALTGAATQCNQKKCYQKCDATSPPTERGRSCTDDTQCNGGRCITGTFNEPAESGCYASWPRCDANVILKVRPDRVCDKWLTCKSSLPVTDDQGRTENRCFDLTICDSLSTNGQCNNLLEGRQCSGDPLRFCTRNEDCIGAGGFCQPIEDAEPLTFTNPSQVSQVQRLTGYAMAGMSWPDQPQSPELTDEQGFTRGYFPLSATPQIGEKITIPNSDFEQRQIIGGCSRNQQRSCSTDQECSQENLGTCIYRQDTNSLVKSYWEAYAGLGGSEPPTVSSDTEGDRSNPNTFLKVTPSNLRESGARTTAAARIVTSTTSEYVITVRMRSQADGQEVLVTLLKEDNTHPRDFGRIKLTTGWKYYTLRTNAGPGGPNKLAFLTTADGEPTPFFVDDVSIAPVLKVNGPKLLTQSCRLYPREDSPACNYIDADGIAHRGLKGYCLERDPANVSTCISWWPVDIIAGENVFGLGQDREAGYTGRVPLYACTEGFIQNNPDQHLLRSHAPPINDGGKFIEWGAHGTCDSGSSVRIGFSDQPLNRLCGTPYGPYQVMATAIIGGVDDDSSCEPVEDRSECREEQAQRGLCYCQEAPSAGGTVVPQDEDRFIRLAEVDSFRLVPQRLLNNLSEMPILELNRSNNWSASYGPVENVTCVAVTFRLLWNPDGTLQGYAWSVGDGCADHGFKKGLFAMGMFKMKQYCSQLVTVATETENAAWADRTAPSSTYVTPGLNFRYISDYAPFGMSVPPNSFAPPSTWGSRIRPEGPDLRFEPPHQVRSGGPYACLGDCSARYCDSNSGNRSGKSCYDSTDCIDSDNLKEGICVSGGVCLKYDSASNSYQTFVSSKKGCKQNSDCNTGEECVGGAAANKGAQTYVSGPASDTDPNYAQYRLQRLFAQSYTVWQWSDTDQSYKSIPQPLWNPPTRICQVCSDGAQKDKACTQIPAGQCPGSSCVDATRHPKENSGAGTPPTADYCFIPPSVTNVIDAGNAKLANGDDDPAGADVDLDEGANYVLKFNSNVDIEQRPLRQVIIDWGDGSSQTPDTNLKIAPRDDPSNPHVYFHTYHCASGSCLHNPIRIKVVDNWGRCNGPCSDDVNDWTEGPRVRVTRR